ncbi:MAG: UPF0158 family protein [Nitrospirota bacterium]
MRKLKVNFDEIQKAMEDIVRNAFDYFLDLKTGAVIVLSGDILSRAKSILYKGVDDESRIDEIRFNEEYDLPDWMEDEVELAIEILFDEEKRYIRIPERQSGEAYTTMTNFLETITDQELKEELSVALNGKGAFARFKNVLIDYPKERKRWYGYNAKAMKKVIIEWLDSIGVEPEALASRSPVDKALRKTGL